MNGQPVTYFPASSARVRRMITAFYTLLALSVAVVLSVLAQLVKLELQWHQMKGRSWLFGDREIDLIRLYGDNIGIFLWSEAGGWR